MINRLINELMYYAVSEHLVDEDDKVFVTNSLLALFNQVEFHEEEIKEERVLADILKDMCNFALKEGIIEDDSVTVTDLFDTKIMGLLTPMPSTVRRVFKEIYSVDSKLATDYFYKLSKRSNYIRVDRIARDEKWVTDTAYGPIDITINLSKPEKDPRDIAKAGAAKKSGYPSCLLCMENEGYAGRTNHPARETHRLIPLDLCGVPWFLQYSPYTYYNEHCIILNGDHVPMQISRHTFENLACFLRLFPHYFAGSNADLPIVGGSILSHDHYQGGRYTFAMERAATEQEYTFKNYPTVRAGRVKWPMSTLRLTSPDADALIDLAEKILAAWRVYSDASVEILAETDGTPHNTITPIARRRGEDFEFDLVFRNNRTTAEHPLGLFHPHAEVHHIKKENIGLIEVLGLAILPARLRDEMDAVRTALLAGTADIADRADIAKHADWYRKVRAAHPSVTAENVDGILRDEIGAVFLEVLVHAGVFKRDTQGMAAFDRWIESVEQV